MKNKAILLRKALKTGSISTIKQAKENKPSGIIEIQIIHAGDPRPADNKNVIYVEFIDTGVPIANREADVVI